MVNKLGHCINYDSVCKIATAQAEKATILASSNAILPLKPANEGAKVLTHFWVANFDVIVDSSKGGGSVNTTHLVAFQELSENIQRVDTDVSIECSGKRKFLREEVVYNSAFLYKKPEPPLISVPSTCESKDRIFQTRYLVWLVMRLKNGIARNSTTNDQLMPNLSGWLLTNRMKITKDVQATVATYLLPITSKITDPATISMHFEYLKELSTAAGMPYRNIALDMGAALPAYKMIWSNPDKYSTIIIYPGEFHMMKEVFQIIGLFISSTGFEDMIFQSNVCTYGSLGSVIAGSHYNRGFTVHSAASEALEQLLLNHFLEQRNKEIPVILEHFCINLGRYLVDIVEGCAEFSKEFDEFNDSARRGEHGKTAQYWLIYLDLMRNQHALHTAVQENDLKQRLQAWEYFIPYCFATNKSNYARYGSFYLRMMQGIEENYPGLKELLKQNCLSVQAQNSYPLQTSTDQRGEQTLNKGAKTTGGSASPQLTPPTSEFKDEQSLMSFS